jgi:hypothetical protein
MQPLVPDIEENIALPASVAEAMPTLPFKEELDMRARTIKLISDLSQQPIVPNEEDCASAQELAVEMTKHPKTKQDLAKYPNETVAFLAGLVAESNHMIVDDLSELKLFVLNNLMKEFAQSDDPKLRTQILTKIGEVDGVDAFKKRSEVTHVVKPIEEVEQELLRILDGVEYKVVQEKSGADEEIVEGDEEISEETGENDASSNS